MHTVNPNLFTESTVTECKNQILKFFSIDITSYVIIRITVMNVYFECSDANNTLCKSNYMLKLVFYVMYKDCFFRDCVQ